MIKTKKFSSYLLGKKKEDLKNELQGLFAAWTFHFLPAENAIQSAGLFSWLLKYFELIIKQRVTSRLARIQIKSVILWYTFHRKLSESWRNLNERRTQKPRWSACWTAGSNYRLALKSSMQPLRKVSGDPCTTWTIDFWSHEWMGGNCRNAKQSKMGYLFTSRIIGAQCTMNGAIALVLFKPPSWGLSKTMKSDAIFVQSAPVNKLACFVFKVNL